MIGILLPYLATNRILTEPSLACRLYLWQHCDCRCHGGMLSMDRHHQAWRETLSSHK